MDLKFYLSLLLRRLHYVILFLIVGAGVGGALAVLLPPRFHAEARLVVEAEQIPGELAASTVQTEASEQLEIIQQRILTREKLLEMANRLQIYAPIDGRVPERMEADDIVEDLRERISMVTTGGATGGRALQATIVTVSFDAPTAQMAAAVTNEVVTLILAENVGMRTRVASQTLDFFEQEVDRLDQELSVRNAAILSFKEANSEALPDSLDFRRSQMAAEQERLLQLEREEGGLKDRRARLVELYEATGGVGAVVPGQPQTPEQRQLQALRDQLSSALAVLSPQNPKVRVLETQITAQEAIVAAQLAAQGGAVAASGQQLSAYDIQLADIDGQLGQIALQKDQIIAAMEALRATIEATPGNAITLDTLERDHANVRAQYDAAVVAKSRAETGEMIETLAKGQRISIIEQAVAPREPVSPNRPVVAAAGIAGGLMLGLGLVLLLEVLNQAIRRPIELTNKLGITPFGVLPYMTSRVETRHRRMRIAFVMLAILVLVPAILWGIHAQIMPLDLLLDRIMRQFSQVLPAAALTAFA